MTNADVLSALSRHPEGMAYRRLQAEARAYPESLDIALAALMRTGEVVRVEGRFFAPGARKHADVAYERFRRQLAELIAPPRETVHAKRRRERLAQPVELAEGEQQCSGCGRVYMDAHFVHGVCHACNMRAWRAGRTRDESEEAA